MQLPCYAAGCSVSFSTFIHTFSLTATEGLLVKSEETEARI